MAAVTGEQLAKLAPYLAGSKPDSRGEVPMRCPFHEDVRRSASLNIDKGCWWCHAGCGGGSVRQLIDAEDTWYPVANGHELPFSLNWRKDEEGCELPSEDDLAFWRRRLLTDPDAMRYLRVERGLEMIVVRKARIGWDGMRYKIPVYSALGELWNVRTYDPDAADYRAKIWSVRGFGTPRLYPMRTVKKFEPGSAVIILEGEWDTLLALQAGFFACTRTGAAKVWATKWNRYFKGCRVFLGHDCDNAGAKADQEIGRALTGVAASVRYCQLPFPRVEKHGQDLTDYCLSQRYRDDAAHIGYLLDNATEEPA